jgi:hypothetical protein
MKTVQASRTRWLVWTVTFRMSRRILKKPDVDTGLVEVVYRCPICGASTSRWVDE